MSMMRDFALGLWTYWDAYKFVKRHKLWGYVMIPGLINVVLLIFFGWVALHYSSQLTDWIMMEIGWNNMKFTGVAVLEWIVNFLLLLVFRIAIFMLYFLVYKYVILVLMAPFMALLSERTEEILTGKKFDFKMGQFLKDTFRGMLLAARNSMFEIGIVSVLYLLSLIPILNIFCIILIFGVQSFFYGFSMIDYYNERQNLSIRESSNFVWQHKGLALANGAGFLWIQMIPVLGILFAPTITVVAACLATHEIKFPNGTKAAIKG